MFQGGFVSWFIFFVILPFLIYDVLLMFIPIRIEQVERELSSQRVERGRNIDVTVHFTVKTALPLLFITACEDMKYGQFQIKNGQQSHLFFAGFQRQFSWHYTLSDLQRGEHELTSVTITVADFFGWVMKSFTISAKQRIIVYPQTTTITNTTLNMNYEQGTVAAKYRAVKDTSLVSGLRDYQPGDRFSSVHWKSFAKSGELRTKEFEDRQSQNITVCLDRSTRDNFEEAVDLTASIIKSAVRNRSDIAFISGGDKQVFYPAIQTEKQLEQVLHHLAIVEPNGVQLSDSLHGKERILQQSVLMIVAGELTQSVEQLLMTKAAYVRQIVCVITTKQPLKRVHIASNCKVITIEREQFAKVFSEVSKR